MKLKLCLLILFFPALVFGARETDFKTTFSYNDKKTDFYHNYLKQVKFEYNQIGKKDKISTSASLKNTDRGNYLNLNLHYEYNVNQQYNFWSQINYLTDEDLAIDSRLDMKVGGGFYLLKSAGNWHNRGVKVSYGMILRNNHILHSFRIRDRFKFDAKLGIAGYEFMANYILPNGDQNFNELEINFKPFIKIFNLEPSCSYEFRKTNTRESNETKFSLGYYF